MELDGKVCVVTGGSRGIGRSICLEMAKAGAAVVVNYCSNENAAMDVASEIERFGHPSLAYKADIADFAQAQRMMEDVHKKFGRIDILVNNAGIARDMLLLIMSEKDWGDVIATNLTGIYNTTKNVARYMIKQRWGRIINISSVVGIYGNAGQANYAAAKAGIIGFTKALAKELGSRGITVNAIAPGFIKTDMTSPIIEKNAAIEEKIPLRRLGTPEDVAYMAVFLASARADYITGQIIGIDGGFTL
ncbi:MAG: 3-oxoacyl-[acyl-carrier-protein] reductase [Tepidanaerobacteraceae bacterium]|jgi:3-oxoacyl-[acyl-carrier protein] reductase|nr:3-oxoacyl-[acyl-carrier-protein] reductase [Tepidanaerobacteraceae bacterium]